MTTYLGKYYEHLTQEDIDSEEWRNIEGYEGLYQVSSCGRVKSLEKLVNCRGGALRKVRESILKLDSDRGGYLNVTLSKNSTKTNFRVHRLVALAFIPNPEKKHEVNHLHCKTDNRVCSLEWVTREENIQHAFANGLFESQMRHIQQLGYLSNGENHGQCKLSDIEVDEIRRIYSKGGISQSKLGKLYGVCGQHIGSIVRGDIRSRPTTNA